MKVRFLENTIYWEIGAEREISKEIAEKFAPGVFEEIKDTKEAKAIENKAILEKKNTKSIK